MDKRSICPAVRHLAQVNKWLEYVAVSSGTVSCNRWDRVTGVTARGLVCVVRILEVMVTVGVLDM